MLYIAICLVIWVLVAIALLFDRNESAPPELKAQLEETAEVDAVHVSTSDLSPSVTSEPDSLVELVPGSPEWWSRGYDTPMDFYGLVLDQYNVRNYSGAGLQKNGNF